MKLVNAVQRQAQAICYSMIVDVRENEADRLSRILTKARRYCRPDMEKIFKQIVSKEVYVSDSLLFESERVQTLHQHFLSDEMFAKHLSTIEMLMEAGIAEIVKIEDGVLVESLIYLGETASKYSNFKKSSTLNRAHIKSLKVKNISDLIKIYQKYDWCDIVSAPIIEEGTIYYYISGDYESQLETVEEV